MTPQWSFWTPKGTRLPVQVGDVGAAAHPAEDTRINDLTALFKERRGSGPPRAAAPVPSREAASEREAGGRAGGARGHLERRGLPGVGVWGAPAGPGALQALPCRVGAPRTCASSAPPSPAGRAPAALDARSRTPPRPGAASGPPAPGPGVAPSTLLQPAPPPHGGRSQQPTVEAPDLLHAELSAATSHTHHSPAPSRGSEPLALRGISNRARRREQPSDWRQDPSLLAKPRPLAAAGARCVLTRGDSELRFPRWAWEAMALPLTAEVAVCACAGWSRPGGTPRPAPPRPAGDPAQCPPHPVRRS